MIDSGRFRFAPRTHHDVVLVSILWVALAVFMGVGWCDQIPTTPNVTATCEENVTLTCNATELMKDIKEIKKFEWQSGGKTLCQHNQISTNSDVLCTFSNSTKEMVLNLTLLRIMPVRMNIYHCKLQSQGMVANGMTQVRIRDCLEKNSSAVSGSEATCVFDGVYPKGGVLWTQNSLNLTKKQNTLAEEKNDGRFKITSTLKMSLVDKKQLLSCSLVTDSKTVATLQLRASGSLLKQRWVLLMAMMAARLLL